MLAIGSPVGQPYYVSGCESWVEFYPLYEAGDYEAAIDQARETVEAGGYSAPLYNLACCEALAGCDEDAIAHLRLAVAREPSLRELAKDDADFDALRDEPAFRELVG